MEHDPFPGKPQKVLKINMDNAYCHQNDINFVMEIVSAPTKK